jgi:VanZ family protein
MELLQNYIPGRTASFYDALANSLGVGIGLILGQVGGLIKGREKK